MSKLKPYSQLIWISCILAFTLFAVLTLSSLRNRELQQKFIAHTALPLLNQSLLTQLQQDLATVQNSVTQVTTDPFIRHWLSQSEADSNSLQTYFKTLCARLQAEHCSLMVVDTQQVFDTHAGVKTISDAEANAQWLAALKNRPTTTLEHGINYSTQAGQNTRLHSETEALFDDKKQALAVFKLDFSVDRLRQLIGQLQTRYQVRINFVDQKGNLVLASALSKNRQDEQAQNLAALKHLSPTIFSSNSVEAQALEYGQGQEKTLALNQAIPQLAWNLLIEKPLVKDIQLQQDASLLWSAIAGFGFLLILVLGFFSTRHFLSKLEQSAATDSLTGLLNRQAFDFVFQQALLDSERSRLPVCVALIDIDFFKKFNDKHGRLIGNHCLKELAQIIKRALRESDIVCRWGGEEFLLMLKNCSLEKATSIAENLRTSIAGYDFSRTTDLSKHRINISVSMGVAECRTHETEDSVFERAEIALAQAKESGRNLVYFSE